MSFSDHPTGRRFRSSGRRAFLGALGGGLGALGLDVAVAADATRSGHAPRGALAPRPPMFPARATAVIQIFCPGGMSHVDTFDYKPELARRAGMPFDPDGKLEFFASRPGECMPSAWPFRQHGECGRFVSDLFPGLAKHVDSIAFLHSMHAKSALHGPAMFMANSGFILPGFPSFGAWATYGLGSEAENLPAFVVLPDPRGLPPGGTVNWGAGFLPAVHQGTVLRTAANVPPIADLFPPAERADVRAGESAGLGFLGAINRRHRDARGGDADLDARIEAFELAARLQLSAPEVGDLSGESALTLARYRLDDPDLSPFGRQCLLARRLVERGVRFVQIYCGAENTTALKIRPNWDSHEDLVRDHGYWGPILDAGASALLADLKDRGLLDSTLVIGSTEFGRQPAAQGKGRDHNPGAFTAWMAGGGVKGGVAHGSSDELGFKAEVDPTTWHDLHATALHLLGIDHERLTIYNNGIPRRLTDVHGRVLDGIVA